MGNLEYLSILLVLCGLLLLVLIISLIPSQCSSVLFSLPSVLVLLWMTSCRYTFCGLAALALINKVDVINLPSLLVRFYDADD